MSLRKQKTIKSKSNLILEIRNKIKEVSEPETLRTYQEYEELVEEDKKKMEEISKEI